MPTITTTKTGFQKVYGFYGNGNGATYTANATVGTAAIAKYDVLRRPIRGGASSVVGTSGSGTAVSFTETARFDFEVVLGCDVTTAGTIVATVTASGGGDVVNLASYNTSSTGTTTGLVGADDTTASNIWLFGTATQGAGKEKYALSRLDANTSAVARPTSIYAEQATNLGTTMTCDFHNIDALCYGGASNTLYSANVGLYCHEGPAQFTGTASQTMGKVVGVYGAGKSNSTNGTLQVSVGVQGNVQNTGAGTTTLGACFYARSPTVSAGTMTTAYGYYAEDVTAGATNYAVYTQAGRVRFFAGTAVPHGGTAGVGVTMSSTNNLGVFFGSGVPTLAAAQGSLYMRTDGSSTSTRMYVNTDGASAWTAVTTAT